MQTFQMYRLVICIRLKFLKTLLEENIVNFLIHWQPDDTWFQWVFIELLP